MLERFVRLREEALVPARIAADILELKRRDARRVDVTESIVARHVQPPAITFPIREAA
jgi:hypothetical protein